MVWVRLQWHPRNRYSLIHSKQTVCFIFCLLTSLRIPAASGVVTTPKPPAMVDDDPHQVIGVALLPLRLWLITERLYVQDFIKGHLCGDLLPVVPTRPSVYWRPCIVSILYQRCINIVSTMHQHCTCINIHDWQAPFSG